jgi:hypothetical protein
VHVRAALPGDAPVSAADLANLPSENPDLERWRLDAEKIADASVTSSVLGRPVSSTRKNSYRDK